MTRPAATPAATTRPSPPPVWSKNGPKTDHTGGEDAGRRRLNVDWTRCDGHGLCAALLPDRVALDEWGFPIVHRPVVGDGADDVRHAVAVCPALALYLA
jgi:ferredoxin